MARPHAGVRRVGRPHGRRPLTGALPPGGEEGLTPRAWILFTASSVISPIIVSRRLADLDPLGPVAASLVVATVALLPAGLATLPRGMPGPAALWSILVLGVVCTALGLIVCFRLIADAGPNRASVITYVNPLVAVVIGVLVLGEHIGATSVAELLLILAGSWLSRGGQASPAH